VLADEARALGLGTSMLMREPWMLLKKILFRYSGGKLSPR
jgi:hypothetical protein